MADSSGLNDNYEAPIFKLLKVDLCARAILDQVPIKDLLRSQLVSRQWLGIVLRYLYSSRSLRFHYALSTWDHGQPHLRKIEIASENKTLLQASKIIEKWGPAMAEVNLNDGWQDAYETKEFITFIKIVASKCPYLRRIEMYVTDEKLLNDIKPLKKLKHVKLYYPMTFEFRKKQDSELGELFGNINCESIYIHGNGKVTGTFLRSLKTASLKSLSFDECRNVKAAVLLSAIDKLRNVTKLEVNDSDVSFMKEVHLLLKAMPQLEELSLRNFIPLYRGTLEPLKDETYESFAGLVNLRRLNMENTHFVNDKLLKALAQGCKKLEVLDIRGCARMITAEGLTALCSRPPSMITTLHFGIPYYETDYYSLSEYYRKHFYDVPLFNELERLGYVKMSRKWFRDTCLEERVRELTLNPRPPGSPAQTDLPQHTLKIAVFDEIEACENGWDTFE